MVTDASTPSDWHFDADAASGGVHPIIQADRRGSCSYHPHTVARRRLNTALVSMGRPLSALWTEEKWPYRWVASEGEPLRSARRTLLFQFWSAYVPFLLLLALFVALAREFPSGPLQPLLRSPLFWLLTAAVAFGAPTVALFTHARRIWRFAMQRQGPGALRVRAYFAFIVFSTCTMSAGLLLSALLVLHST